MVELALRGIKKLFGEVTAVDTLDLEVRDGEFMVLVGPSGCGKTTLLRIIAGLEDPTAGEVWMGGRCVNETPPRERRVGMVFQNYALYPHLRVRDNIQFGLKMRKVPAAERDGRVMAVAGMLGISDLLERRPSELSGGQRQRVALARAIAGKPDIFLMDEPLSNLDAKLRTAMRTEIKRLQRKLGTTTIYVTHDQLEALTMGDRIAVLRKGRLMQVGTPDEIYSMPANTFVAGFVGSPPMNFFRRVPDSKGEITLFGRSVKAPPATGGVSRLVVGIRPEDLKVVAGWGECDLVQVESLGSEFLLHLEWGDDVFVARLPRSEQPVIKQRVAVEAPAESLHWFDELTGRRLNRPPDNAPERIRGRYT